MNEASPTPRKLSRSGIIKIVILVLFFFIVLPAFYAALNAALAKSKIATATAKTMPSITALESAINNFHVEYGKMPDVDKRVTTDSPEGIKLLSILLGTESKPETAINSRQIKFLAVKEGKDNRKGLIYASDGKSIKGLYDPWGSPYTVILSTEDKEELRFKIGSRDIHLKGRRGAAFSPGPDKQIGTSDDVKTW